MTRAMFFKHFELLADQPDAVAKMRGLVLELAIRGQLVERSSKDEPASKLLEKIKTEKGEFLRASKLKEAEALPQICADEAPFKCPSAWEWVRLGSISNRIHYGYTASADHSQQDVRLLRITDIQDNQVNWETVPGCQISAQEVTKYALRDNDILIARTGGTIGKTFLVSNVTVKAVFASYLIRVIPSSQISAQYLKLFLESPCYWRQLLAKSAGTGQPNVNGEALSGLCISLPPLAEQRRIVAKVEELMALCDELEQRQQARQHARAHLTQSAYHHLTAGVRPSPGATTSARAEGVGISKAARSLHPAAPEDGRTPTAFVLRQFAELTAEPDDVPQLRQAILQLAVQGRLVPQNPKDELAAAILERCQREAKKLGIKTAEQQPIESADTPFELPTGWSWARLRHLGYLMGGGTPSKSKPELWDGKLPWVSPKDMKVTHLSDSEDHISRKALDESAVKLIPPQSLLFVVRGMILIHPFPAAINTVEVTINQDMKALRPFEPSSVEFLLLACRGYKHQMLERVDRSSHGTCKLITEKVTEFVIGLPPLAEQKRIVARVEELLRWCDTLEAQLHQTRTLGGHLLDSTLHHLLAA